jgi:hypothetical protein
MMMMMIDRDDAITGSLLFQASFRGIQPAMAAVIVRATHSIAQHSLTLHPHTVQNAPPQPTPRGSRAAARGGLRYSVRAGGGGRV